MHELLGAGLHVAGEDVRAGEPHHRHPLPGDDAADEVRGEEGRVARHAAHVALLLHRDGDAGLERRRAHRVRARLLTPALQVLEERGKVLQLLELVWIDREEVPGRVLDRPGRGEHERHRVVRLADHLVDARSVGRDAPARRGRRRFTLRPRCRRARRSQVVHGQITRACAARRQPSPTRQRAPRPRGRAGRCACVATIAFAPWRAVAAHRPGEKDPSGPTTGPLVSGG